MQTVPFSDELERALIVSVLQDSQILPKVQHIVGVNDFYKDKHKKIFEAILSLDIDNIDSLTVQDKLDESTQEYFKILVEDADRILPAASNALFYAETIKSKSKLRAGIEAGQQIIAACYTETDADEAIHQVENLFADFLQKRVQEDRAESTPQSFKEFLETLGTRRPDDPNAIRTGFDELDVMIQRLEGLAIVAAKTSLGKTSYAINITLNNAKLGHKVLFFSLEQPKEQVFERMISVETEIPLEDIKLGLRKPTNMQAKRLQEILENIHIDDKASVPTSYITSVARQKYFEWGKIGLIVVDYLHLLNLGERNIVESLGQACKDLRGLGKELGCPVLLLSQLSRGQQDQNKKPRRPELQDLRQSGEIEQVSDQVFFLYRESYNDLPGMEPDEDVTEVLVRKNRSGPKGIVELKWFPKITKFKNMRG